MRTQILWAALAWESAFDSKKKIFPSHESVQKNKLHNTAKSNEWQSPCPRSQPWRVEPVSKLPAELCTTKQHGAQLQWGSAAVGLSGSGAQPQWGSAAVGLSYSGAQRQWGSVAVGLGQWGSAAVGLGSNREMLDHGLI